MTTVVLDPQARGYHDDGTESGLIRTAQVRGEYTKVAWRAGHFGVALTGGASAGFAVTGGVENSDESGSQILVTVPAGINQGAIINFWFYGTALGIRSQKGNANSRDFSLLIDGTAYHVPATDIDPATQAASTVWNAEQLDLIATDLPDGKHFAQLVFSPDPSALLQWVIYGYTVERRAGYQSAELAVHDASYPQTLTTTQATVKLTGGVQANNATDHFRGIRKVIYTNTTGSPAKVTVQLNGATCWQKTVQGGDSDQLDFGAPASSLIGALSHAADTASAINYVVVGQY